MGLLFAEGSGENVRQKMEIESLHKLGCQACRLKTEPGRMEPTGSAEPLVYILGEAPGNDEIRQGEQFVGRAGQLLRPMLPPHLISDIRWNNVVRSRPPNNRDPEWDEIEACRPSIIADIERTRPPVIWGFGGVPLHWICGFTGIALWRGRKMPVRVGNHVCWYYAFFHPSYLLRISYSGRDYGSEDERITALDIKRAYAELSDLPPPKPHTIERAKSNVEPVYDLRAIEQALIWAARQEVIGVDYETTCLRPYERGARILSAAVATPDKAYAFPIHSQRFDEQTREDVATLWRRFLMGAPCVKAVHNLAFEMEWSGYFFGEDTLRARPWADTATAASILDERRGKHKPGCFALEFLVQQYFGFNLKKISSLNRKQLANAPLEAVLNYNGMDSKYHAELWLKLREELKRQGLEEVYRLAERRVPTLVLAQLRGLPVNENRVHELDKKYTSLVKAAEAKVLNLDIIKKYEHERGEKFNPHSQPNLVYVFDTMLGCPEVNVSDKQTKKAKKSVDESVLSQIDHPLASATLELRDVAHNKSAFIDPLVEGSESYTVFPDGCLHPIFNSYYAETGRLSAEQPNVQQWPKRDEGMREVRSPIQAPPGHVILSFDYGQIEARVIAMYTRDERFCKMLWERYDIHTEWAERIAAAYPDRVGGRKNLANKKAMKDFRTDIKNQWTFPLVYGAKMESAAGYLNIPTNVIKPLFETFWKEFDGIHKWQDDNLAFYQKYGYTECLTGRRRHGPMTVNQIHNSPIQGTACEIVLDAMCTLSEKQERLLQPEMQIHDDLTFVRVPVNKVDEVAGKVVDVLLKVPFEWVNVPISVEMSCGKNWADMEDAGTFFSDEWFK